MPKSIKERIADHYHDGMSYFELRRLVFPRDQFPRAWRYSLNGGPPGCAMAFGKALREMGLRRYKDIVIGKVKT